jgi:hypothetical protein
MATTTQISAGGTSTTTVLKKLPWVPSAFSPGATSGNQWPADLAQMMAYADVNNKAQTTDFTQQVTTGHLGIYTAGSLTIDPQPRLSNGVLYYEGRGQIKMQPGDFLYVDPVTGWPIVIPAFVKAGGSFI